MKIYVDTDAKTISVEEELTFGELVAYLENLLPVGVWREYKLIPWKPFTTKEWPEPIQVPITYPPTPTYPGTIPYSPDPNVPWIIPGGGTGDVIFTSDNVTMVENLDNGNYEIQDSNGDVLYGIQSGLFCVDVQKDEGSD